MSVSDRSDLATLLPPAQPCASALLLQEHLRQEIAEHGPRPLDKVMGQAVATYYAQGTAFGRQGDFITAPEISQTFGEVLGLWAAVVWQGLGMPSRVHLVELGPGRGTLMSDALRAARALPPFFEALSVHLVETSPTLRDQQRAALTASGRPLAWHDGPDTLPDDAPVIVLANEFFDALPIEQWCRQNDGWHRRLIDWDAERGAFVFVSASEAEDPAARWGAPFTLPTEEANVGTVVETCPIALHIMGELTRRLSNQRGAVLAIDYGYAQSAIGDSLQAMKGHRYHPPLQDLGAVDLTAHVDFSRLLAVAGEVGGKGFGPISQRQLLCGLGIEARVSRLMQKASPAQQVALSQGVSRLINPSEMGTLFKVIAVTDAASPPPPGFEVTSPL